MKIAQTLKRRERLNLKMGKMESITEKYKEQGVEEYYKSNNKEY